VARVTRFTVTADIVTDITSSLSIEDILAGVVKRSTDALEVWECDVYEYAAESGSVTCSASYALEEDPTAAGWVGSSMAIADQPAFVLALHEGRMVAIHLDDPGLSARDRERMEAWGERSCLFVPIVVRDEVIGCLELVEKRYTRVFSPRDRQLAATLAALTAMAIQNSLLYAEVKELAITDGPTGLYNHRYFYERLIQDVARAARYDLPVSLLMIDIDDFKAFNDRAGHRGGDALLQSLGELLLRETRQRIDLVARYGGDELAIIMPSTGEEQPSPGARAVAERIRRRVEADDLGTGREPPVVTISVGVAGVPQDADSADGLVEQADRALYLAKQRGKNRVEAALSRRDVDGAA